MSNGVVATTDSLAAALSRHRGLAICMALLAAYFMPLVYAGEELHISHVDRLDSFFARHKLLWESGHGFSADTATLVPQAMNGQPIGTYQSAFKIVSLLFFFLEPLKAYIINYIIVGACALIGMYMFLLNHVLRPPNRRLVAAVAALCFAVLPFFAAAGLAVAGQPLILNSFLNICRDASWRKRDFAVCLFFPFYSVFGLTGIFICPVLAAIYAVVVIRSRKLLLAPLLALAVVVSGYVLSEHQFFRSVLLSADFTLHRVEFDRYSQFSFEEALRNGLTFFKGNGHFHTLTIHSLVLRLFVPCALLLCLWYRRWRDAVIMLWLLGGCLGLSLLIGLWRWREVDLLRELVPILQNIDVSRFHWFLPLLWYVLLARCLWAMLRPNLAGLRILASVLLAAQLFYEVDNNLEYSLKVDRLIGQDANRFLLRDARIRYFRSPNPELSYREFFSADLFSEIKEHIGRRPNDYRVVNVGLHPSITQFAGFYTLDSYANLYLLSYKHAFRRVIAKELAKSNYNRWYFDKWGSRCYILAAELEQRLPWHRRYLVTKDLGLEIERLDIDTQALRDLGGDYLFSAVRIQNAAEISLELLEVFERADSPYRIHLYEVAAADGSLS